MRTGQWALLSATCFCFLFYPSQQTAFGSQHDSQHVLISPEADPHGAHRAAGFVSVGDSYSAGIGTPFTPPEAPCRLGNSAYPPLIHTDFLRAHRKEKVQQPSHDDPSPSPSPNNTLAFQWLSCTGATATDLLTLQLDAINTTLPIDFATLSIGGNDLGFFDVINACVFRFYSFYSGTCAEALARSERALNDSPLAFELDLTVALLRLLDLAQWWRRPDFTITVTGYARFFNATTEACDHASLGVWYGGPKLERELREKMNWLVESVNAKLRHVVEVVNLGFPRPRVLFVDYDELFEGHRFCEEGVEEPDYKREETWFFLISGPDNGGNETMPNGTATADMRRGGEAAALDAASPLIDPETCLSRAQETGDWGELAVCYMAMAKRDDPTLLLADDRLRAQDGMWYVPTSYGKVFHPRTMAHRAIRDKIYKVWVEHGMKYRDSE